MKSYTDHYDSGFTHLFTGKCVTKDSLIIEAIGVVDELNSTLGVAHSLIKDPEIKALIEDVQSDLLDIGADLATPEKNQQTLDPMLTDRLKHVKGLTEMQVKKMEDLILKFENELPPLRNFILPSGSPGASQLQLARAFARRAERRMVAAKPENVNYQILKYFNRLSDFLFYLGRVVNHREGGKEVVWRRRE